ncbi:MAG: hypothetical protein Q9160_004097 [Pyrenula sp. 1 TL-2023]
MQIPPLLTIGILILSSTTIILAKESTPISSILSSLSTNSPTPDSNSSPLNNINNSTTPQSAPSSLLTSTFLSAQATFADLIPSFPSLLFVSPSKQHPEISQHKSSRQVALWALLAVEEEEELLSNPAAPIATPKPKREIIGASVALVGVMGIMAML